MTPRTLFTIVVKIFGLFFVRDIFQILTDIIPLAIRINPEELKETLTIPVAMLILYILIYSIAAYYLLIRTDLVIDKLKLEKGFEDDTLNLVIHRSSILSIAVVLMGGYMIIDGIPTLLGQLKRYYSDYNDHYKVTNPTISYMVISISKIALGFLLVSKKRWIVNFIESQRRK